MMNAFLVLLLIRGTVAPGTDFGVRMVGSAGQSSIQRSASQQQQPGLKGRFSLEGAAALIGQYGRVTSTRRSAEHNRRVGGVPNSWHLHGRAIDVARSPSVSHAALALQLRRRGYHLIESLDEGDHSHFAFSNGAVGPRPRAGADQLAEVTSEASYFRFVEVPGSSLGKRKLARR